MSYRGDDLDLRLPPGQGSRTRGALGDPDQPLDVNGTRYRVKAHRHDRNAPLWVDDTMMAVCNAAHEVAQALHSPEVLLQHLVHGMTRVTTATSTLLSEGVDIEDLRRDVTALISSTAARTPDAIDKPLTSSEFKAALRLSGEAAGRRGGDAITVADLFDVLMNYDSDHPGVALLLKHVRGDSARSATPLNSNYKDSYRAESSYIRTEPLYSLEHGDYQTETRSPPAERVVVREVPMASEMTRAIEAMEGRVISRLSTLEGNYRSELHKMDSERLALGDVVKQLHADITAHRGETGHMRDMLDDKLQKVERATLMNRGSGESTAPVITRLQGLERLFDGRFEEVAKRTNMFGDQLRTLEANIRHQNQESADIREVLETEIRQLGTLVVKSRVDLPDLDEIVGGRLDTIETMLLDRAVETQDGDFSQGLVAHIDETLAEHHKQIAQSMAERERNWGAVNDRLNKLEHLLSAQNEVTQNAASDRKRLFEAMNTRLAHMEQSLTARTDAIQKVVNDPKPQVDAANTRLAEMEQRLSAKTDAIKVAAGDPSPIFESINSRMAQMEKLVVDQSQRTAQNTERFAGFEKLLLQNRGPGGEQLVEVKNALSRISSAQQTTAEVFDQWRVDLSGDLNILNEKMEHLELSSVRSAVMPAAGQERRVSHETETHARNTTHLRGPESTWDNFYSWLFGPR